MSGNWDNPSVPNLGWCCGKVVDDREGRDPDEPWAVCEMCEAHDIRWLHAMEHDSLPGVTLWCGCVCFALGGIVAIVGSGGTPFDAGSNQEDTESSPNLCSCSNK
jgi:hypothetical protein